jgi:putative transposase
LQPAGKVRLILSVVHETDPNTEDAAAGDVVGAGPDLDELCRLAAREMIAVALEAERRAWLDAHAEITDATGKRLVVDNGYLPERTITTGAGQVEVKAPRVADKRAEGEREPFSSGILPRYMRTSPKVTEVLPVLYLRGLSTGDFAPALEGFFGSDAGLSASTVNRLTEAWQAERPLVGTRPLGSRLRVHVGRWGLSTGPTAGRGRQPRSTVSAGDRGRAGRWDQGAGHRFKWLSGVDRVVGRGAA